MVEHQTVLVRYSSKVKWVRGLLALFMVAIAIIVGVPIGRTYGAPTAVTVPRYTISYYITSVDPAHLYNLGVSAAQYMVNNGITYGAIILNFGQPATDCSTSPCSYGTYDYGAGNPFASTFQIQQAVKSWTDGFYLYDSGNYSHVRVLVGTNNYIGSTGVGTPGFNHGYYWADTVNRIADYVRGGYAAVITVSGANDIETNWSPFDSGQVYAVRRWVDGWHQIATHVYYDFGDAAGCPQSNQGNAYCNSPDWYMYSVWWKATGATTAWPVPQINFFPPGDSHGPVQANQWANLARNAASGVFDPANPRSITFYGETTDWCALYEVQGCPPNGNPT